jgi:hypothetical protein
VDIIMKAVMALRVSHTLEDGHSFDTNWDMAMMNETIVSKVAAKQ